MGKAHREHFKKVREQERQEKILPDLGTMHFNFAGENRIIIHSGCIDSFAISEDPPTGGSMVVFTATISDKRGMGSLLVQEDSRVLEAQMKEGFLAIEGTLIKNQRYFSNDKFRQSIIPLCNGRIYFNAIDMSRGQNE